MHADLRHALAAAAVLAGFALAGAALVAVTEHRTRDRIADNERRTLLDTLDLLIDPARYDNDPVNDTLVIDGRTVYRARKGGEPVALVMTATAPDGYSGPIRLLVGVNADGTVAGVRVLAHRETPGLGDDIETARSDWILSFDGRSLSDPTAAGWTVERDGGAFDQFTGATITPRAVVRAVHDSLRYFAANQAALW